MDYHAQKILVGRGEGPVTTRVPHVPFSGGKLPRMV